MSNSARIVILVLTSLVAGCGGGFKDTTVTDANKSDLAAQLDQELTVQEAQLLQSFVERRFPELPDGMLPTGMTIATMIDEERAYQSGQAEAPGSETASTETAQEPSSQSERGRDDASPTGGPGGEQQASGDRADTQTSSNPVQSDQQAEQSSADAEPAEPEPIPTAMVAADTPLEVRIMRALSTKTDQAGQSFSATLDHDLAVDGAIVAPEGAEITGRILECERSGRVKGRARMQIAIMSMKVGDQEYKLDTHPLTFEAEGSGKRDATRIAIATGIGAAVGAIAGGGKGAAIGSGVGAGAGTGVTLATRGKEVEFPAEQLFQFRLRSSLEMTVVQK